MLVVPKAVGWSGHWHWLWTAYRVWHDDDGNAKAIMEGFSVANDRARGPALVVAMPVGSTYVQALQVEKMCLNYGAGVVAVLFLTTGRLLYSWDTELEEA